MADQEMTSVELEKISLKPIKGSKKSKKSWRNADIEDVEEYLEEARRDERTGGPASEKPDEALFFVEKGSEPTTKKIGKKKSKVGIEADDDDDVEYVPRKKKLDDRLQKEADILEKKIAEARAAKVQTIWGQEVMTVTDAYLESTVKKEKVKPKTVGVGKSDIDAVIVAEPGTSYNPDYDSHQELLLKAHEEELKVVTEQTKLCKTVKMVSVKELKKQSRLWLEEMSEGLSQNTDEPNENVDTETPVVIQPVSCENRKTAKQRRKELETKNMKRIKVEQKRKKVRLNDIMRIKSLKKEINRNKSSQDEGKEKRHEKISTHEHKPKRLSRYKFVEARTNVQLSEELKGTLRQLKPDGTLLNDRFRSLQRRNIIETRNRVLPRRRYKRKDVVKHSYKTSTIKDLKSKR